MFPVQPCGPADIVILLDYHKRKTKLEFAKAKQFVIDIAIGIWNGNPGTRITVIGCGSWAETHWELAGTGSIRSE